MNEPNFVVMSHEETDELYRYMVNQYLDPNKWPALRRLIDRAERHANSPPKCPSCGSSLVRAVDSNEPVGVLKCVDCHVYFEPTTRQVVGRYGMAEVIV